MNEAGWLRIRFGVNSKKFNFFQSFHPALEKFQGFDLQIFDLNSSSSNSFTRLSRISDDPSIDKRLARIRNRSSHFILHFHSSSSSPPHSRSLHRSSRLAWLCFRFKKTKIQVLL
ncbi:hypothetical protein O181_024821 [Austropuccinia psidii MF-1]|uniref:Uncharacterized protein n=1 Tax=Austropuccinia psidii MF-1 TaxID=1389203 RepID=A0A9Q3CM64_9BASI|nr:hypothetical protein [Austropuccinia psidii MF-1]